MEIEVKKMDYKELIERLKECAEKCKQGKVFGREAIEAEDTILDDVDAIKALLAEREVAVRNLTEVCEDNPDVCHLCKHLPCVGKDGNGRCLGWQWHGLTPIDRERMERIGGNDETADVF